MPEMGCGMIPFGRCGMPCGICPMYHIKGHSRCPGCIDDPSTSHRCSVYKCTVSKNAASCSVCPESPCSRLTEMKEFKNLDSGRVWLRNLEEMNTAGNGAFFEEYAERTGLFNEAMRRFDDGRMKNFMCRLFMTQNMETLRHIMLESGKIEDADRKESAKKFRELSEILI